MKLFVQLFHRLDQSTNVNQKREALVWYFSEASDIDRLWTIGLLSNKRPKRIATIALLKEWATEITNIPVWLFEESQHVVGDLVETITLLLPMPKKENEESLSFWINYIKNLESLEEEQKKEKIIAAWQCLQPTERLLFNKLLVGGFRIGISQKLMVEALAQYTGIKGNLIAHRLTGNWIPDNITFEKLILTESPLENSSSPYPFHLASTLEGGIQDLGAVSEWSAERKWDGIRGQIIVRQDELFVWSRGEELLTDKLPEYHPLADLLPNGTVIDGAILPFKNGQLLNYNELHTRLGRKNITKKAMDKTPIIFMAYDLLEWQGEDIRLRPFRERRHLLQQMLSTYSTQGILVLSEDIPFDDWGQLVEERALSRKYRSQGLMLKRWNSSYSSGRQRGDWWKWKADALTINAVMIYAQRGNEGGTNLYSNFTMGVWDGDLLMPFTKVSGLTEKEASEISAWVSRNTRERFGPVRSVEPVHVFEIVFDGIRSSSRHKSGVVLRSPRIIRWCKDQSAREANTLNDLKAFLELY